MSGSDCCWITALMVFGGAGTDTTQDASTWCNQVMPRVVSHITQSTFLQLGESDTDVEIQNYWCWRSHRWRCRAARRCLCPKPGSSLSDWSLPPLKTKKKDKFQWICPDALIFYPVFHRQRPTFDVGDVDVELAELLTGPLNALVNRLHDLPRVLLHPSDQHANTQKTHACMFKTRLKSATDEVLRLFRMWKSRVLQIFMKNMIIKIKLKSGKPIYCFYRPIEAF